MLAGVGRGPLASLLFLQYQCNCSILAGMRPPSYQTRKATPADAVVIASHRRRMFVETGRENSRILDQMSSHFLPWLEKMMLEDRYIGWLTSSEESILAGAGLLILDWPPHPLDPAQDKRGYLLNIFVEPEHRRRKIASRLIELALAEAQRRRIRVISLHSTEAGKSLYQSNGFRRTNEMFYIEPGVR